MVVKKTNPLIKIIMLLVIIVMVGVGLSVFFADNNSNNRAQQQFVDTKYKNDTATADTPVESLKTLTAELSNVEQQNKKIVAENEALKQNNKLAVNKLENSLTNKIKQEVEQQVFASTSDLQHKISTQVKSTRKEIAGDNRYPIGGNQQAASINRMVWIEDLQEKHFLQNKKHSSSINKIASILNPSADVDISDSKDNANLITVDGQDNNDKKKIKPIPYYTMPIGSTLTGAVLMEPLVGRIPINGRVPDPYHFKVILGTKNLAANGIDIPPNVQGIVATGYVTGDMLRSCAMGNITTMTFVFPDGQISTTVAKNGNRLGYISATNGDPCLLGSFHTNAAEYLGGSSVLAGIQGYANALSQVQTVSSFDASGQSPNISMIVKNGNRYALGQGVAAGALSAQNWWNSRIQNSFDYVYVPNISAKGLTKVDIHIEQQIDIDYNQFGRKVSYEYKANPYQTKQLD